MFTCAVRYCCICCLFLPGIVVVICIITLLRVAVCDSDVFNKDDNSYGVHLSYSGIENEISVIFSTPSSKDRNSYIVKYGVTQSFEFESSTEERTIDLCGYERFVYEAFLSSLDYNTSYYYQIFSSDLQEKSQIFECNIFSDAETEPVDFIVAADQSGEDFKNIVKHLEDNMLNETAKFFLFPGDISFSDKMNSNWDSYESIFEPVSSRIPIVYAPGNHDIDKGYQSWESYKTRISSKIGDVSNSNTNYYYSFKYQIYHIITLSTEHDFEEDSEQYKWAKKEFKSVNRSKTPFLIVQFHKNMYTSSGGHSSYLCFRHTYEHLFQKYHVTIVFTGHVHGYERTCEVYSEKCFSSGNVLENNNSSSKSTQGSVHVIVGTLGRSSKPWKEKKNWDIVRNSKKGFLRCSGVKYPEPRLDCKFLEIIKKNGDVIEAFEEDRFVIMHQKCFGKYVYDKINVCSGHGDCMGENICVCEDGFIGILCNQTGVWKKPKVIPDRSNNVNDFCPKVDYLVLGISIFVYISLFCYCCLGLFCCCILVLFCIFFVGMKIKKRKMKLLEDFE